METIQEAEVCCVCLEGYEEDPSYTYLGCGHRMHTVCLRQYIQNTTSTRVVVINCPLCRYPILFGEDDIESPSLYVPPAPVVVANVPSRSRTAVVPSVVLRQYTYDARIGRCREQQGIIYSLVAGFVLISSVILVIGLTTRKG